MFEEFKITFIQLNKLQGRWLTAVFLASFLSAAFSSFGQLNPAKQKVADSLEQVSISAESDTVRIDALGKWAKLVAPFDNDQNESLNLKIIQHCDDQLEGNTSEAETRFYRNARAQARASLGINYFLIANYLPALDILKQSADEYKDLGNMERVGTSYIIIGALFKNQEDFESAKSYFYQALDIHRSIENRAGLALALNNLGDLYTATDSAQKAETYLMESLAIYEEIGARRGQGVELLNLGKLYHKTGELDKAVSFMERSLEVRTEINDLQGQMYSRSQLGKIFFDKGDLKQAKYHGQLSLELALQKGYPRGLRDANEVLYLVYHKEGNFKLAFDHFEQFIAAKDSITNKDNIRAVTQAEYTYRYENELAADSIKNAEAQKAIQLKLALKESENEQQKLTARILWGSIILALILGAIMVNRYRQTNRQKKIIEEQKTQVENAFQELAKRDDEKEILLKEIHHRVKNNLQVISSLLDLQTKNLDDELALSAVTDGQNRVKAMALIHEKLYQNEDVARLNFRDYVKQLMTQTASIYPNGKRIQQEVISPDLEMDIDTAIPLGLILSELLTNGYKYAFQGNDQPKVIIELEDLGEGSYCMKVKDNGPGLPPDFNFAKAKSLGLRLVRRLSRQLYGSAVYSFEDGAVFTITFKDTLARKSVY